MTKEEKAAYDREYRRKNASRLQEQKAVYRAANVDRLREYFRQFHIDNKVRRQAENRKRYRHTRAMILAQPLPLL